MRSEHQTTPKLNPFRRETGVNYFILSSVRQGPGLGVTHININTNTVYSINNQYQPWPPSTTAAVPITDALSPLVWLVVHWQVTCRHIICGWHFAKHVVAQKMLHQRNLKMMEQRVSSWNCVGGPHQDLSPSRSMIIYNERKQRAKLSATDSCNQ